MTSIVPSTPTSTPPPTVSTITIGETNVLSTDDAGNGNLLVSQQVSLSQSATIQSLSFYVATASGHLRLGIYDATGSSGGPGVLKAQTVAFTPTTGWNTQNVTAPVLLSPGTYWLAYLPESSSLHFRMARNGMGRWYSYNYGSMPGSYSTSPKSGAYHWSFYATFVLGTVSTNTVISTSTPLPTNTLTSTPTSTQAPSVTPLSPSPTNTLIPTSTFTQIASPTSIATYTSTSTPTVTALATFTPTRPPTLTATRAPTDTATSIATFTRTPTPAVTNTPVAVSTITVGETSVLSTDDLGNGNLLVSQQVTLSQSATIQSLSFYVMTATGHLRLGIYDATGPSGGPGALKAQTNAFTPTTGWNTQNVTAPVLLSSWYLLAGISTGEQWIAFPHGT